MQLKYITKINMNLPGRTHYNFELSVVFMGSLKNFWNNKTTYFCILNAL